MIISETILILQTISTNTSTIIVKSTIVILVIPVLNPVLEKAEIDSKREFKNDDPVSVKTALPTKMVLVPMKIVSITYAISFSKNTFFPIFTSVTAEEGRTLFLTSQGIDLKATSIRMNLIP